MEKTLQFRLEDFTGPLDLLLALVTKNKMSIYDIEIMTLIDQYLEIVETASATGPEAMEAASEFIVMAARLVQMKSTLLLPKSDEGERMKEELTGLLVEYSACKEVAGRLREMAAGVFIVVRKPLEVKFDTTYALRHPPVELAAALRVMEGRSVARRQPDRERFDEIVSAPVVSIAERVAFVVKGLMQGTLRRLRELFTQPHSRGETVATFLALLELIRDGRVSIDGQEELHFHKDAAKGKETVQWN